MSNALKISLGGVEFANPIMTASGCCGYGEELSEIQGKKGRVRGVLFKSGKELSCQIVGVAIGVRPVLSLVEETSLEKDQGLLVNNHLQTNVREVFAAGDVHDTQYRQAITASAGNCARKEFSTTYSSGVPACMRRL